MKKALKKITIAGFLPSMVLCIASIDEYVPKEKQRKGWLGLFHNLRLGNSKALLLTRDL